MRGKGIKKIAKIGLITVMVLIAIPALSLLFLQNRQVQTMLSSYLAERISGELGATISIGSVNYSFFRRVQVRDAYIEDAKGDTLIYAGLARLRIGQFNPEPKGLTIKRIIIEDAWVNLVIDSLGKVNLTHFTDRLKKPHVPPEQKSRLHIASIHMIDSRFSLSREGKSHGETQVDFNDFHLDNLEIKVKDLESYMDTVRMDVDYVNGTDHYGFHFREVATRMSIGRSHLHFHDIRADVEASSLEIPLLSFDFERYRDFKQFSQKVDLDFISGESELRIRDLASFIGAVPSLEDKIYLSGRVHGKASLLRGQELVVSYQRENSLAFDFTMIGLPDIRNTFMDIEFRQLNTSSEALQRVAYARGDTTALSGPFMNLGAISFQGGFTGYPDQFVATGLLESEMGRLLMDLSFTPDSIRGIGFQGSVRTNDFKLGQLISQPEYLGEMDMNVKTEGNLYRGRIRARMEGSIDSLEFYNYSYSNITLDGLFTNTAFMGGFSVSDPNIKMDFEGKMDFSGEIPEYKFTADVSRIRPHFLNLPQDDPSYFASFLVETDLNGSSLDELNGEIRLVNSMFEKTDAYVQIYDLTLQTRNTPEASLIRLRSEHINADITGKYKLSQLPASFRNMADHYVDVFPLKEDYHDTTTYLNYQIDVGRLSPLLNFFAPGLSIGEDSQIRGTYNPATYLLTMDARLPYFSYRDFTWHNVLSYTRSDKAMFKTLLHADSLSFGDGYTLVDQEIRLQNKGQVAHASLTWTNDSHPLFNGAISMNGHFKQEEGEPKGFHAQLEPGFITINDTVWKIQSSGIIAWKDHFQLDSFMAENHDRQIAGDGVISRGDDQDFSLSLKRLQLAPFTKITGSKARLEGEVSGNLNYRRRNGLPILTTNLNSASLSFNAQNLGSTDLRAEWDNTSSSLRIRMVSQKGSERMIEAKGDYHPASQGLDFDIHLKAFDLESVNPYTEGVASDLDGLAQVNLTVDGTLDKPEINGQVEFTEGKATIDFLKAPFHFSDHVRIYHNNIYFEDFRVTDPLGNPALINGSLSSTQLKEFYINLNIDADNLQCMNTTVTENEVFYGSIFGTGNVQIKGPPSALKLDIKAQSEENTRLFLPLYNASEVSTTSDFITFIRDEDVRSSFVERSAMKVGGLEMDLSVEVTDDAVVQLIFDPKVGDIIETSGSGNLRIGLNRESGFRILGDVVLNQGDYLFTLQNVINKRFKIEPGGRISFNGSPLSAGIDLEAIYTTRAAPYNLYPDQDDRKESLKKRIPVECHLLLQGELQAPTIATGISMPTADAETRDLLANSTSTDEELMRQFLSLLVINNFYSVTGYGTQELGTTGNIAGVTASEVLSNQLSNWLSKINDDFDIGINYRPGDEITSDELEIALSTQILDDRVIISGNVGMGGQETNPSVESGNPYIMGDFDLEFRVTDNVSILAFNRARDELLFETAPYKQGVGISYREEFDNLQQLINRYREGIDNRKRKRKEKKKSGEEAMIE